MPWTRTSLKNVHSTTTFGDTASEERVVGIEILSEIECEAEAKTEVMEDNNVPTGYKNAFKKAR